MSVNSPESLFEGEIQSILPGKKRIEYLSPKTRKTRREKYQLLQHMFPGLGNGFSPADIWAVMAEDLGADPGRVEALKNDGKTEVTGLPDMIAATEQLRQSSRKREDSILHTAESMGEMGIAAILTAETAVFGLNTLIGRGGFRLSDLIHPTLNEGRPALAYYGSRELHARMGAPASANLGIGILRVMNGVILRRVPFDDAVTEHLQDRILEIGGRIPTDWKGFGIFNATVLSPLRTEISKKFFRLQGR